MVMTTDNSSNGMHQLRLRVVQLEAAIEKHRQACERAGGGFLRDEELWEMLKEDEDYGS